MNDTETQNSKIATSVRLEAEVYGAIAQLAAEEDRPSQANMMERLLKTHPQVAPLLRTPTEAATA